MDFKLSKETTETKVTAPSIDAQPQGDKRHTWLAMRSVELISALRQPPYRALRKRPKNRRRPREKVRPELEWVLRQSRQTQPVWKAAEEKISAEQIIAVCKGIQAAMCRDRCFS